MPAVAIMIQDKGRTIIELFTGVLRAERAKELYKNTPFALFPFLLLPIYLLPALLFPTHTFQIPIITSTLSTSTPPHIFITSVSP